MCIHDDVDIRKTFLPRQSNLRYSWDYRKYIGKLEWFYTKVTKSNKKGKWLQFQKWCWNCAIVEIKKFYIKKKQKKIIHKQSWSFKLWKIPKTVQKEIKYIYKLQRFYSRKRARTKSSKELHFRKWCLN